MSPIYLLPLTLVTLEFHGQQFLWTTGIGRRVRAVLAVRRAKQEEWSSLRPRHSQIVMDAMAISWPLLEHWAIVVGGQ
eukprot:189069-Amphidinium_carterae.1